MRAWDFPKADEKNPQGLKLEFLQFKEEKTPQQTLRSYRVYIHGAPVDKEYSVAIWQAGKQPTVLMPTAWVNKAGLLMAHKPTPEQMTLKSVPESDEVDFAIGGSAGEPLRIGILSKDGTLNVAGTIVPFPIQDSAGNCTAQAVLAAPDASLLLIEGRGFAPNTKIHTVSISEGDRAESENTSNAKGELVYVEMPFVDNKDHGIETITLTTPACTLHLAVKWGKDSYKLQ